MEVGYQVEGDKAVKPESVYLILRSYSKEGLKYKDDHRLTIHLDDEMFLSAEPVVWNNAPDALTFEFFSIPKIKYEDFLKILESKKVTIELGQTKIDLDARAIKDMRDLNKTIEN